MSYCKQEGKDKIIFLTREDHEKPSDIMVSEDNIFDDTAQGAILPNGQINWECPCLGGMASGPCGTEFRDAFSCFHYSTAAEKGGECLREFRDFSDCLARYPDVYGLGDDDDDVDGADGDTQADSGQSQSTEHTSSPTSSQQPTSSPSTSTSSETTVSDPKYTATKK